jgi:hypothetical protein
LAATPPGGGCWRAGTLGQGVSGPFHIIKIAFGDAECQNVAVRQFLSIRENGFHIEEFEA